ncbi:hypothetical protein GUITHDRAFT_106997 [Guillardia theta CCMP2712]|uniref:histone acetyltransferase n=2 Tax=Guillardia theta TaxID=55529 RepID=L1JG14_GUITC|nr:hypothetical protein GUITHDRAFT_106997 [Guillardia theta CCMP2712]EKX47084.1 hypothetical protein GUITHDRAFT_106997 [Guillardia theta CCMP2712]|eukprot:XP_005834064.1 hypothetical protein GUITHDRAFT_106997 [Guillardia theta CCMP2712]
MVRLFEAFTPRVLTSNTFHEVLCVWSPDSCLHRGERLSTAMNEKFKVEGAHLKPGLTESSRALAKTSRGQEHARLTADLHSGHVGGRKSTQSSLLRSNAEQFADLIPEGSEDSEVDLNEDLNELDSIEAEIFGGTPQEAKGVHRGGREDDGGGSLLMKVEHRRGPPILSPYLQHHRVVPSSRRADFESKWMPKEVNGSVMTRLKKELGSKAVPRTMSFLKSLMRSLSRLLPTEGRMALIEALQSYEAGKLSEVTLAERIKGLVDQYRIVVPLEDGHGYLPWRRSSNDPPPLSFDEASPANDGMAEVSFTKKGKRKLDDRDELADMQDPARRAGLKQQEDEEGEDGCMEEGGSSSRGAMQGETSSEQLEDTPMAQHITGKVRSVYKSSMPVRVRVVGEKVSTAGGYLHRSKAIMAFQEARGGKEILLFAMYTNEFGADAQAPNTGRVYIECIDGLPLRPNERGEEREELVRGIMYGYLEYMKLCGFSFIHLRVPPPHDSNCQIFSRRPADVRLQWSIRMSLWLKKLLRSAAAAKIIDAYQCGAHGSILNYPPTLLPARHLYLECTFAKVEAASANRISFASQQQLRERLFVVRLHPGPRTGGGTGVRAIDRSPLVPATTAASRQDLIKTLTTRRWSFHTLAHATTTTTGLLQMLISEQRAARKQEATEASSSSYPAADTSMAAASSSSSKDAFRTPERLSQQLAAMLERSAETTPSGSVPTPGQELAENRSEFLDSVFEVWEKPREEKLSAITASTVSPLIQPSPNLRHMQHEMQELGQQEIDDGSSLFCMDTLQL